MTYSLDQSPPNAVEAEQSVLSACFISPESVDTCADIITPDDFYKSSHQKIYKAILDLRERKEPIDLPSVVTVLKDRGQIGEVGGATYVSNLLNDIPLSSNVSNHASIVKQKAVLRAIIKNAALTIQDAYNAENASELLDTAQQRFLDINNPVAFRFTSMCDLMTSAVDQIEKCAAGELGMALPTGLADLDNNMGGGIRGSKLMIICARPGIGKTAIALNMAGNIAAYMKLKRIDGNVGFLELEMEREEIGIRSIAMRSGVNTVYLFAGKEKDGDSWVPLRQWDAITSAAQVLSEYPILIDDTPALPLQEVVRRVRMLHKQGCRIVFIDQLSKIRGPGLTEYEQKTAIVNRLAELKKELRMPIVLLAQINREGFLKSTGSLEEDSDIIMRLQQTTEALDRMGEVFKATLTIDKHRGGPTGEIPLQWWPKITAFRNHTETIY